MKLLALLVLTAISFSAFAARGILVQCNFDLFASSDVVHVSITKTNKSILQLARINNLETNDWQLDQVRTKMNYDDLNNSKISLVNSNSTLSVWATSPIDSDEAFLAAAELKEGEIVVKSTAANCHLYHLMHNQ